MVRKNRLAQERCLRQNSDHALSFLIDLVQMFFFLFKCDSVSFLRTTSPKNTIRLRGYTPVNTVLKVYKVPHCTMLCVVFRYCFETYTREANLTTLIHVCYVGWVSFCGNGCERVNAMCIREVGGWRDHYARISTTRSAYEVERRPCYKKVAGSNGAPRRLLFERFQLSGVSQFFVRYFLIIPRSFSCLVNCAV